MGINKEIRVAAVGVGNGCRDDLIQAMAENGWSVDLIAGVEELAASAISGEYHLALIGCQDPCKIPRGPLRTLIGLQTDMSVVFLIPNEYDIAECVLLMGATSDQLYKLDSPTNDLMEAFQQEVQSILSHMPEYAIVCIDDDWDFLTSLRASLSTHLNKVLPGFALNIETFTDPQEALEEMKEGFTDRVAVIISDQIMPEMKGIELLQQAKSIYPEAKCVLLTGFAALDSAVTAINEKILDKYFFKPVDDLVDFANNIRNLLLEHHLQLRANIQHKHLMSQFEFIRTMSAAKTIDDALSVTADFLLEQVCPDQAMIVLADGEECTVRAGINLSDEFSIGTEVGQYSLFKQVFKSRQSVVISEQSTLLADLNEPLASLSLIAVPIIWGDLVLGIILMADRNQSWNRMFTRDQKMMVNFVADITAMTVSNFENRRELEDVYLGTMATLMETVEAKDIYTRGHTDRVTELTSTFAKALGIKGKQLENIKRAAALHDIGKIAVPDKIILKPGPLNAQERCSVEEHPERADRILQHLKFLNSVRIIARAHHEKYDGTGYPDGLQGEEIPIGARILAIVDSYDAMTSARPYREAMSLREALTEIENNAGKHFDPKLVGLFSKMMNTEKTPESLCEANKTK